MVRILVGVVLNLKKTLIKMCNPRFLGEELRGKKRGERSMDLRKRNSYFISCF